MRDIAGPGAADFAHEVLENLLEGCQFIGTDYRYRYLNGAAARQGRAPQDELLGRTMMEAYPGIESTAMFEVLRGCMDSRVPRSMENEFTYADGSKRWFELRFEPAPEGVVILSLDITERKRAEAREAHLNAVLRAIRNVNQLLVQETDQLTLLRQCCEILTETRGYPAAWIGLSEPEGRTRVAGESRIDANREAFVSQIESGQQPACVQQALANSGVVVMHAPRVDCGQCALACDDRDTASLATALRVSDRDFGVLVVSLPAHLADDVEEQSLFLEVAGDISFALRAMAAERDHGQTTAALWSSTAKLEAALASMTDAVSISDADGRFVEFNEAFATFHRFASTDECAKTLAEYPAFLDVYLADGTPAPLDQWAAPRALRGETVANAVYRLRRKDTGESWIGSYSFAPIRDKDGAIIGAVVVGRDITEQQRAEAERANLQAQLEQAQKMESIGRLAGGVAHDFNNLLSVILSYAGFAAEALRESDPLRADVVEIQAAARRAATLTRQLLAFGRKQILKPEPLDLRKVITGTENMIRRLLGEDIEVVVRFSDDIGTVMADPGQLEQVLVNLAVNARDAMPRGGTLTIDVANVELGEGSPERHLASKPGRYVVVSVSDTGCGMDAATKERIFEPFFTTKEKGKGTGLGLSTVYGIVTQSGGQVSVESEPGRGAIFRVHLPHVDGSKAPASRKPTPVVATGVETVLIVEDEEAVRKLAERILRSAGYEVLTAAGGGDALLLCERHGASIALLLTDVVMPQMSGRELAERLAKVTPGIRVLYMSGYDESAVANHGALDPGTPFITKPFSPAELTRKVRQVLDVA
jgi:PAS domain S-box-containing protein